MVDLIEPSLGPAVETLLEMRVDAEASVLPAIRKRVGEVAAAAGFRETDGRDIVLAVDEACCNTIVHTYKRKPGGVMALTVERCAEGIRLRLRDYGPPVPVERIRPRDLDDIRPGGLGTHFINSIMDSARFLPGPDGKGNIFEMTKRFVTPT